MRSGYIKHKCELCGKKYTGEFYKDVVTVFWQGYDYRNSSIPTMHECDPRQRGLSKIIGYIICEEGQGW